MSGSSNTKSVVWMWPVLIPTVRSKSRSCHTIIQQSRSGHDPVTPSVNTVTITFLAHLQSTQSRSGHVPVTPSVNTVMITFLSHLQSTQSRSGHVPATPSVNTVTVRSLSCNIISHVMVTPPGNTVTFLSHHQETQSRSCHTTIKHSHYQVRST